MEIAQKSMKKQFDKKQRNLQGLKVGDNMWLENKNIHLNRPSKKLNQKRYEPFRISKNIGLGVFQLKLPEEWMIHNMFNKDLLTRCKEPQFKGQHMELAPPSIIINKEEEYEVKEVQKHRKQGRKHSIWCIGRVMGISMTNGSHNQGYLMQKRQLKTIG